MATPDTGRTGSTDTTRRTDAELTGAAYSADMERDMDNTDVPVPRELREGASTGNPGGLVSPEVRSDYDGPLRGTGLASDRDSGAGASAGHDTGGEQASRNAQARLNDAAQRAMQRGNELAAAARERVQRLKEMDAQRDSFPGEHWLTLGAGLYLMTRRRSSFLGQLFTVAAGAALVYRSMTGRDSLVPALQAQASRLSSAVSASRGENWTMPEDEQRQERSSQMPM
jgi:hypothetical protein